MNSFSSIKKVQITLDWNKISLNKNKLYRNIFYINKYKRELDFILGFLSYWKRFCREM